MLSDKHPDLLPTLDQELLRHLKITKKGQHGRPSKAAVEDVTAMCAEDPAFYIFGPEDSPVGGFVRTFDEKDHKRKPLPRLRYLLESLEFIHNMDAGDVAAIVKSRQMMLSWLVCAYASWEAHFHPQARVMIQSKKAEDAWNLVYRNSWYHSRIGFIERAVPRIIRAVGLKGTRGELWYPEGGIVMGIPQGPDMYRSYSASLVISDESCFQPDFEEAYKAALPMCKGDPNKPGSGGRIILVSSAKGDTYFADLVGQSDEEKDYVAA